MDPSGSGGYPASYNPDSPPREASSPPHTTLPPIREALHRLGRQQHSPTPYTFPAPGPPGYNLPMTTGYSRQSMPRPESPGDRSESAAFRDTDAEGDPDNPAPQKKKRRRQALSCTECKRRKIKCDRAQPCGPCVRRNEQDKCQWHVLEPVEKYVTRAEFDDLKARHDRLEDTVTRLRANMEALHTSASAGPSTSRRRRRSSSSPRTRMSVDPSSSALPEPPPPPAPPNPHGSPRMRGRASPFRGAGYSAAFTPPGCTLHLPESDERSPIDAHVKPSPLSLAAITSPYIPAAERTPRRYPEWPPYVVRSKNFRAQTFESLGERLRMTSGLQAPAAALTSARLRPRRCRLHRRPSQPGCTRTGCRAVTPTPSLVRPRRDTFGVYGPTSLFFQSEFAAYAAHDSHLQ